MTILDTTSTVVPRKSPNKGGWAYAVMPGPAQCFGTSRWCASAAARRPPVPQLAHGPQRRATQLAISAAVRAAPATPSPSTAANESRPDSEQAPSTREALPHRRRMSRASPPGTVAGMTRYRVAGGTTPAQESSTSSRPPCTH